jgi:hypothetical protein
VVCFGALAKSWIEKLSGSVFKSQYFAAAMVIGGYNSRKSGMKDQKVRG